MRPRAGNRMLWQRWHAVRHLHRADTHAPVVGIQQQRLTIGGDGYRAHRSTQVSEGGKLIAAGAPDAGTAPELFVTRGAILCVGGRGDVDNGRMQALRERARELGFSGAVYMRASESVPEVA